MLTKSTKTQKIKEIMCKHPDAISANKTLKQAAIEMQKYDFGFLPVKQNGHVTGVITDRDIVLRAISKGKDPSKIKLKDAMSKKVFFCYETDDLKKAAQIMSKKQINRLAVYNKKKQLTGILSLGDITRKCKDISWCGKISKAIHKK